MSTPAADPADPTASPTADPTASPTADPTASPTADPTASPTADPTASPTADPTAAPTPGPTPGPTMRAECFAADAVARAERLLQNRYRLGSFAEAILPADPTWRENPLRDANWEFRYHSLIDVVQPLVTAWVQTGDDRYRDRAVFLIHDWLADNPIADPPSLFSWNDHSTAQRAIVLECAYEAMPADATLRAGLLHHGLVLAQPSFWTRGNHAVNQMRALLEVGCHLRVADWVTTAVGRLGTLAGSQFLVSGVVAEQSIGYWRYNQAIFETVRPRVVACGRAVPATFARLARVPLAIAHATLPNGEYELIGDTNVTPAAVRGAGDEQDFAATLGKVGRRPASTVKVYADGYAFARTGWGTSRSYRDETMLTAKFGPGRDMHSHADGGSITLYGFGARLLLDPGLYGYRAGSTGAWFAGRTAHNVVTVDGSRYDARRATRLLATSTSSTAVALLLRNTGDPGVTATRRIIFSRRLGYVVVEDRLVATSRRTFRQLWHLPPDASPAYVASGIRTNRLRGNIVIRQLVPGTTTRVVRGRLNPMQGWYAATYGRMVKAPVIEAIRSGTSARYLTVILPSVAGSSGSIRNLRVTATGFRFDIRFLGRAERVTVSGTTTTVTPID